MNGRSRRRLRGGGRAPAVEPSGPLLLCALLFLVSASVLAPGTRAQEPMQDVVYLVDGSVIRGTIVELVPEESVRIRTRDGSVFAYGMDEVERITREPAVRTVGRKNPGTALAFAVVPGMVSIQGAGQWYNGEIGKGFLFFGAGLLGGSLVLGDPADSGTGDEEDAGARAAVGAGIWLTSLIWSSIDAYGSAQRINRERGFAFSAGGPGPPPPAGRHRVLLGFDRADGARVEIGLRAPLEF